MPKYFTQSLPRFGRALCYILIGISIGLIYAKVAHTALMFGFINGVAITLFVGLLDVFLERTKIGFLIRNTRSIFYFLVILLIWTSLILMSLEGVTHFFARLGIYSGDPLRHQALRALISDIAISICFVFCVNFLVRIRALIGGKTLVRLMLGYYRRPLWEDKVFLFVDIVNSTGITQSLGSGKAQSIFTDFFADIDEPIHMLCGEIHRYLGDEVVVTWPLNDVDSAIAAVEQIGIKLRDRTSYYSETYGIVPKFRAGVHGGEIVSGKVGNDRKREIVFFGDTINTTARLTALSGELGVDVLVSERMVKYLKKPYAVLTPLGAFQLKGISNPMGVYQFSPQTWK